MTPSIWLLLDSRAAGGIESHVAELASGLLARGDRVRVLFFQDHGPHPLRKRLDDSGVAWEALAGGLRPLLLRLRAADAPDILHTHGYKANLFGRVAALLCRVKHVATYHAGEDPPGRLAWYDRADRWTSWLGRRIAVSRPILKRLPFGGQLVPNFIALPPMPDRTNIPDTIGFVGRMSHEKGPDLFCDLARLAPGPHYAAFGGGAMLDGLRAAHGDTVTFHGALESMAGAWREIGLLAVTSRAEGLPLAVLEAMARGVPVAAFAVGALPEVIEDGVTGFIAPAGDLPGLARRVAQWRALGPAGQHRMAGAARAVVAERFSREAGVEAISACYAVLT